MNRFLFLSLLARVLVVRLRVTPPRQRFAVAARARTCLRARCWSLCEPFSCCLCVCMLLIFFRKGTCCWHLAILPSPRPIAPSCALISFPLCRSCLVALPDCEPPFVAPLIGPMLPPQLLAFTVCRTPERRECWPTRWVAALSRLPPLRCSVFSELCSIPSSLCVHSVWRKSEEEIYSVCFC